MTPVKHTERPEGDILNPQWLKQNEDVMKS